MASTKISAFASGNPIVATDEFPIARAGANYKVTLGIGVTGTGELWVGDGLIGAPSYAFISEPDCGMYVVGANDIGFVAKGAIAARARDFGGGVSQFHVQSLLTIGNTSDLQLSRAGVGILGIADATGVVGTGSLKAFALRTTQGTNLAVAVGSSDAAGETGIYFSGDSMIVSINTGKVLAIGAGNGNDLKIGTATTFGWTSGDLTGTAADTGLARSAAGVVRFTDGSTGYGSLIVGNNVLATQMQLSHNGTYGIIQANAGAGNVYIYGANFANGAYLHSGFYFDTDYAFISFGTVGGNTENRIGRTSVSAADATGLWTGSTSNAWLVARTVDRDFDFAHAAQTNPAIIIHSAVQSTTQYLALFQDQTDGVLSVPNVANTGIAFDIGGTKRAGVINDGTNHALALAAATVFNWGATTMASAPDTGLARASAAHVKITNGSTGFGSLILADGTSADCAIQFDQDPNTGIFSSQADYLQFSVGGSYMQLGGGTFNISTAFTVVMGDVGLARINVGQMRIVSSGAGTGIGWCYQTTPVTANTGTATPAENLSGHLYTNTGDADGSAITLPNNPSIGVVFRAFATAAQIITLNVSANETILGAEGSGTSIASNGGAGADLELTCVVGGDGGVWGVTKRLGTWTIT